MEMFPTDGTHAADFGPPSCLSPVCVRSEEALAAEPCSLHQMRGVLSFAAAAAAAVVEFVVAAAVQQAAVAARPAASAATAAAPAVPAPGMPAERKMGIHY